MPEFADMKRQLASLEDRLEQMVQPRLADAIYQKKVRFFHFVYGFSTVLRVTKLTFLFEGGRHAIIARDSLCHWTVQCP